MHGRTWPESVQRSANDARREALFVSALQPSDAPTADMITGAVMSAMQRFGARGCTARMQWARQLAA
jgi:hypothetical protein